MSKFRKILVVILSACCAALCCAGVAACSVKNWRAPAGGITDDGRYDLNNPGGAYDFYYPTGVNPDDYLDQDNRYVISTVSLGGMPIDGVRVSVNLDGESIIEGISRNGVVQFGIPENDYELSYGSLPLGYREDSSGTLYNLTPDEKRVTTAFVSSVINQTAPDGLSYSLGDVMYNFRFTNADGRTVVLTELLSEKRMVLLNFWATWCGPCVGEFPMVNSVYNEYRDYAEVVAISNDDYNEAVKNFQTELGLDFFMAHDSDGMFSRFETDAIPVSVIIDRYGVVAFINVGAFKSDAEINELFKGFTADNYVQNISMRDDGETGTTNERVVCPTDLVDVQSSDSALNQSFLHSDMVEAGYDEKLTYYAPAADTGDGYYNWPWHAKEDSENGSYIAPSNVGTLENGTENGFSTNNTWAIISTELDLDTDDTLSVEVKLNTETNNDCLYIIINNSTATTVIKSGKTVGWETVKLITVTRPTHVVMRLVYDKSTVLTVEDEFVGLKNLKITALNTNTDKALDVLTDAASVDADGSISYADVYYSDPATGGDGFYHVCAEENVENPETDSILFVDVYYETFWSSYHLNDYVLTYEGSNAIKSVYLLSYIRFQESSGDSQKIKFKYAYGNQEISDAIINCFYAQDGVDTLAPVSYKVAEALKAFAQYAYDSTELRNYYENGYNEYTWLELCSYYRTLGRGSHTGEHENGIEKCLATTNPAVGRLIEYAISLNEYINYTNEPGYDSEKAKTVEVDTSIATHLNRIEGTIYSLTAPKAGVYSIKSLYPYKSGDPVDPKIVVWAEGADVFYGRPLIEQDDTMSSNRFEEQTTNFNAIIYLDAGETIIAQISTRMTESTGKYDVIVEYIGETHYELQVASSGDGFWLGTESEAVYMAIDSGYNPDEGVYCHLLEDGRFGSPIYIDFIRSNFYDSNGHSLKWMIDNDYFVLNGGNLTAYMNAYYAEAIKVTDDHPYGMVPADPDLVEMLVALTLSMDPDASEATGAWKAFAYYYQYYGPTLWEDMD